ncbi:MAG: nucleotide exchange factor GrpE [Planctomycetaceae bacterium]
MSKREKQEPERAEGAEGAPEEATPPLAENGAEGGEEWRDRYLRTLADLDNFRKRVERDREQARLYAVEKLIRDLLPALDSLEMACAAAGDAEALREGVSLALQEALRILGERGVASIEALGELFDPRFHEAAGTRVDAVRPQGTILEVLRRGYKLHERLLRPARVVITVSPPRSGDAPEGGGGESA